MPMPAPTSRPDERTETIDAASGRTVIQWTNSAAKDQHLYFTSPSVTDDDRWLVFLSDRSGAPNLFAIERAGGRIHQVSANEQGVLRSYVFPTGGDLGLGKVSPCLDAARNRLYFIQDGQVYRAGLDKPGDVEPLALLPAGWWTACNGVSADGRTLCVPVTDPRAYPAGQTTQWEQLDSVPPRMRSLGLATRLLFFDTTNGRVVREVSVPFWVTHVQFDPSGSERVALNQEGWTLHERPRVWALDESDELRPLSLEGAEERASHEVWMPDGSAIVYHGWTREQEAFIEAVTWAGQRCWRHLLSPSHCGHLNVLGGAGATRIVLDGRDGWLRLATLNDQGAQVTPLAALATGNWQDQDAHAHPAPTAQGRSIVFTSDRAGTCNVYELPL